MALLSNCLKSTRSSAYLRYRRRLLTGLVGTAVLATVVVAWQIDSSLRSRRDALQQQTRQFARAVEAHVQHTIHFVDLSLLGYANAVRVLPREQRTPPILSDMLSSGATGFTHDFWISMLDAKGMAVATSSQQAIIGRDYADREYFKVHKNKAVQGLYISGPDYSRASGRRVFFLSRRLESADGQFLGVIVAPLEAGRFANVFENSRISDEISIALIHKNGRVIARAPDFERAFNYDVGKSILFEQLAASPAGSFRAMSEVDRDSRMYSYRAMGNLPLVVVVGHSDRGLDWFNGPVFAVGATGVVLLLALMTVSGLFALRAYARLEDRETRYRQLYITSRQMEDQLSAGEQRLRLIADNLPIMIAYIDRHERYTFANRRVEQVFGLEPGGAVGRKVADIIGQQAYSQSRRRLRQALAGHIVCFDRPRATVAGTRWDAITYVPDVDPEKKVRGLFVMAEDITERRANQESMKLAALMYQNSSDGMMVTDGDGLILSVNPAFTRISGYSEEEVKGHWAYELTSGRQDYEFFRKMRLALINSGQWEGEVWHQNKHGQHYLVSLRFNAVFDKHGAAYRRVALFSDITRKKASEELIWKQANFDALTGLPNRRMFGERLRQEMKKTDRSQLPMALLFIDLDGFKEVNDTLGHDMGDILLKEVAQRLLQCVRNTDIVARLGGDEFTIIIGELRDPADVLRTAQEILKATATPVYLDNDVAHVSASIGISLYPEDAHDADTLVKNADQAMYAAKQQGRDRFHYFAPSMQEASRARMTLANELRDALEQGQLRILFQPIVALGTGRICKAEALVRWQHPTRGLLEPDEFITVAEQTGTIVAIGEWVFRQAARVAKRVRAQCDPAFALAVNSSAWQFRDDGNDFAAWLDYLEELQLPASAIIIEVNEGVLLESSHTVAAKLRTLHDAGLRLALDDFGTGYCSIGFLKRYDLDFLKIDPAFFASLAEEGSALCEALIALAHKMGIQVIAEGMESLQKMAILQAAGCDFGQGYLYSRPVAEEELVKMLGAVDKSMDIHRKACE